VALVSLIIVLFIVFAFAYDHFRPEVLSPFGAGFDAFVEPRLPALLWGLFWVYAAFLFGLIVFLFAPGVFKSAYGRELLFNSEGCQINSQSAPDSIDRHSEFYSGSERSSWGMVVTLYRADDVRRGLRHGLYDDPQCAERIAAWLAANRGCPRS
jgi:hypothetical protein